MSTEIIFPTYVEAEYKKNTVMLKIHGRNENRERVLKTVMDFKPYFYVPFDEPIPNDNRILKVQLACEDEDGKMQKFMSTSGIRVKKIIADTPSSISGKNEKLTYLKDYFSQTFESDVLFTNRALIDLKLNQPLTLPKKSIIKSEKIIPFTEEIDIPMRIMIMDLENDDTGSIDDAKDGNSTIYCECIWDSYTNEYHIFTYLKVNKLDIPKIKQILKKHWKDTRFEYMKDAKLVFHTDYRNEPEMLSGINTYLAENYPDLWGGWNFEDYDVPVHVHRCQNLNIPVKNLSKTGKVYDSRFGTEIGGLLSSDLMEFYDKLQEKTVRFKNLNYISNKELGTKKLPRVSTKEMSQTNVAHMLAYNIIDVQLTKLIEEKIHLIDYFKAIAQKSISRIGTTNNSQLIDNLLFDFVKGKYILPTRKSKEELEALEDEEDDFVGGKVYESQAGIHHDIVVLDYSGLYPSIMRSLNISIETKDPNGEIKAANGIRFKKNPRGIVPQILESLLKERNHYKKLEKQAITDGDKEMELVYHLKQIAVKILMNAFFGVLGFKSFRLNDVDTASAITTTGQFLSMSTKEYVENTFDYNVIYGDTDSLFLHIPESNGDPIKAKEIGENLCNDIHDYLSILAKEYFNIDEHYFRIEFDKYFFVMMQVNKKTGEGAKKRYAGYQYDYGFDKFEFTAKGFELKRASSSILTQETQKELITKILDGEPKLNIVNYLNDLYEKITNGEIEQTKLSLRYNITRNLIDFSRDENKHLKGNKKFMSVSRGYRGALNANKYLNRRYGKSDTIMLYFVDDVPEKVPYVNEICLDFDEPLPEGFTIDTEECWNSFIVKPMASILDVYGIDWAMINDKTEQTGLFDYNEESSEQLIKKAKKNKKDALRDKTKLTNVDIESFKRKPKQKDKKEEEFNLFSFAGEQE